VDQPTLAHNMAGQIIGTIDFNAPFQFTFVYPDNRRNVFNNIVRFSAMRTGCYCLFDNEGTAFVIRPVHEYIIEKPQPSEEQS
jgi:hypothetical protein